MLIYLIPLQIFVLRIRYKSYRCRKCNVYIVLGKYILYIVKNLSFSLTTDSKDQVWADDVDARLHHGISMARRIGYINSGDMIVLVTGWTSGAGSTNTIRVVTCPSTSLPSYTRIEVDTAVDERVRFE